VSPEGSDDIQLAAPETQCALPLAASFPASQTYILLGWLPDRLRLPLGALCVRVVCGNWLQNHPKPAEDLGAEIQCFVGVTSLPMPAITGFNGLGTRRSGVRISQGAPFKLHFQTAS